MKPAPRLFWLLSAWSAVGLAASFWPHARFAWFGLGAALLAAAAWDALALRGRALPRVERRAPGRFPQNTETPITLELRHDDARPMSLRVQDDIPKQAEIRGMPVRATVEPMRTLEIRYTIRFFKRGPIEFKHVHLLMRSPWRLWDRHRTLNLHHHARIYPNYEPIVRYAVLSSGHQTASMGVVNRRRAGMSREFHQLREYREGDLPQQIDWKATSRLQAVTSREYREQRDQNIVFLIDDGRRMRAMDADLSQFDHVINATLLLSYIATRQGDSVSMISPCEGRYMPPTRGPNAMTSLLNHLYDLEPTAQTCDYHQAASMLMARQTRHALVVILTNLRSEDAGDLIPAMRLLRSRHTVLIASIREAVVDRCLAQTPGTLDEALTYHAAMKYRMARQATGTQLKALGAHIVDAEAHALPTALANTYNQLKGAGIM